MDRDGYNGGGISIERKLELIQKIRQEHQMNQNTVRGREAFLYGNKYAVSGDTERLEMGESDTVVSTLKLRIAMAALLFGIFYSTVLQDGSFMGINASQVYAVIETDYSANLFDFMEEIPYTLHE